MNKRLLGAVAAIVAVLGLIGGGTFAAWSDFATVQGNTNSAGALVLELDNLGTGSIELSSAGLAPGMNKVAEIYIANRGDNTAVLQNALLSLRLEGLTGTEDGCSSNSEAVAQGADPLAADPTADPAATCNQTGTSPNANGQFADQAYIQIAHRPASGPSACGNSAGSYGGHVQGTLASVASNSINVSSISLGTLNPAPANGRCVRIEMGLPNGAGGNTAPPGIDFAGSATTDDRVQGDSATFNLRFDLNQAS